jgi:hypothetical protein
VVRERSAKPLCVGSIPTRASKISALSLFQLPATFFVYLWCTLRSISATGSCSHPRCKCDESGAAARAENLRAAISTKPFQAHAKSPSLSISIGVALSTDFVNEDVDKIIAEADRALYTAKAEGRNCVRVARLASEPECPIFRSRSRQHDNLAGRISHGIKVLYRLHLTFARLWSIIWRIATVEPGARFSRQASRRLQVSSMPEKR